jgi:hypothetical protein
MTMEEQTMRNGFQAILGPRVWPGRVRAPARIDAPLVIEAALLVGFFLLLFAVEVATSRL